MSRSPLEPDLGLSLDYLRNSLAPKTWQDYYSSWCSISKGYVNSDLSYPDVALLFVNNLISQGLSFSHVSRMIAGVSFFHKWHYESHMPHLFLVKQVPKGFRKGAFSQDTRRPITFDILKLLVKACEYVCKSPLEVQLFKTAFSLAFFGAFCIGKLVAPNRQGRPTLLTSDVVISD